MLKFTTEYLNFINRKFFYRFAWSLCGLLKIDSLLLLHTLIFSRICIQMTGKIKELQLRLTELLLNEKNTTLNTKQLVHVGQSTFNRVLKLEKTYIYGQFKICIFRLTIANWQKISLGHLHLLIFTSWFSHNVKATDSRLMYDSWIRETVYRFAYKDG